MFFLTYPHRIQFKWKMQVQISPAPQFNGSSDQNMMLVPPAYHQPISNGPKSDLAFQCMVCNETFDDPTLRYEHMSSQHSDLYGNGFDNDSDDELSDDLTRLLEPICEIKLIDEDNDEHQNSNIANQHLSSVPINSFSNNGQVVGEHLGLQIGLHVQMQLQLALQQHLMQTRMHAIQTSAPPLQLQPLQPPPQLQTQPQSQPTQEVQMQTTNGNQSQPTPLPTGKIFLVFDWIDKYSTVFLLSKQLKDVDEDVAKKLADNGPPKILHHRQLPNHCSTSAPRAMIRSKMSVLWANTFDRILRIVHISAVFARIHLPMSAV